MELDLNLENLHVHKILLQQMLENLEMEHHDFIIKESLDIKKSYMSEFEGKVSRALIKQKVRLQLAPIQQEPENDTKTQDSQGGAKPARRFLTRTIATWKRKQEASLTTAIHRMELDLNPENVYVHEVILHRKLENLEAEHHNFDMRESLDINREPEKFYMLEFEWKVSRALKNQRVKLQMPTMPSQPQDRDHCSRKDRKRVSKQDDTCITNRCHINEDTKGSSTPTQNQKPPEENQGQGNGNKQRDQSHGHHSKPKGGSRSRVSLVPDRRVKTQILIHARRSI
jgi:hypothetical protein